MNFFKYLSRLNLKFPLIGMIVLFFYCLFLGMLFHYLRNIFTVGFFEFFNFDLVFGEGTYTLYKPYCIEKNDPGILAHFIKGWEFIKDMVVSFIFLIFTVVLAVLSLASDLLIYCKDMVLSVGLQFKVNIFEPVLEHFFVQGREGGSYSLAWDMEWLPYYNSALNYYDVQSGSLLYLLALMFFFPLGIFLNYKGRVAISKITNNQAAHAALIRLDITRYLCNLWLFFNLFFIIFYILQFDFISTTRFFFLPSMNSFDLFLCLVKIILLISYLIFLVIFKEIILNEAHKDDESTRYLSFEYLILTGFFILGSLVLLGSETFIEVFLSLEIQSYSLYILAGSDRKRILSSEAGLKYFIFGSFSSLIGLLGIAILYYETGFFDLRDVLLYVTGDLSFNFCGLGLTLFLFNLFFKLGIFPFHFWMPDVFHGSPLLYTIFFSSISKIGPFGFFLYFCSNFLPHIPGFSYLLFFVSVASIVLGSVSAFGQRSVKKLIGYSSIGNLGFCCLILANDFANISSVVYSAGYFIIYIFTLLGFFSVLCCLQVVSGEKLFQVDNFEHLSVMQSYLAFGRGNLGFLTLVPFFCIFLFSFAGIPPFLGFFAKFFIFYGLIESNYFFSLDFSPLFLIFIGILLFFVILMAFYYLRLVKYASFLPQFSYKPLDPSLTYSEKSEDCTPPKADSLGSKDVVSVFRRGSRLIIFQIVVLALINLTGIFWYELFFDFILAAVRGVSFF